MTHDYNIFVSTFNCGKAFPFDDASHTEAVVRSLIPSQTAHDVYALGFQELVPIWEGSFPKLVEARLLELSKAVLTRLEAVSHGRGYQLVGSNSVGAVGLLVYAASDIAASNVLKAGVKLGMFYSGLKGAAVVKVTFSDKDNQEAYDTFTFVSAHLAANEGSENLERRISDYASIVQQLKADFGQFPDSHTIFFGDFNFRVNKQEEADIRYTESQVIGRLLASSEELGANRKAGKIFREFDEAEITFPPTYKYLLSVTESAYNPKRQPSWCDRILYKKYNGSVKVEGYTSVARTAPLRFTDHQAVTLSITVPHVAQVARARSGSITAHQPARQPVQLWMGNVADTIIGYCCWINASYGLLGSVVSASVCLWVLYVAIHATLT